MTVNQKVSVVRYFHADCSFNETLALVFASSNDYYSEALGVWLDLCKQYNTDFR